MHDEVVIISRAHQEYIDRLLEYEERNHISRDFLKNINESNEDYPEDYTILGLCQRGLITEVAYLKTEKDLKVCQIELDGVSSVSEQKRLLKQAENFAYTNLGMEEVLFLENEAGGISSSYLIEDGYEDLGEEGRCHIFIKPKEDKNMTNFHR